MDITKQVTDIEEFMGRDFGQPPEVKELNFLNQLRVVNKLHPQWSASMRKTIVNLDLEEDVGAYYHNLHTILYPKDSDSYTMVHELTHAYTKNHWPEAYSREGNENFFLGKKLLSEGLAEYVCLKTKSVSKFYGEILLKYIGKPVFSELKQKHLEKGVERVRILLMEQSGKTPGFCYALGALAVASVLEFEDDKHEGFSKLVNNMPPSVYAITSIIDPNIYEVFKAK